MIRTSTDVAGAPSGRDAEPEPRALTHAGRHAQPHLVRGRHLAIAGARRAPLRPHLAAAAAPGTRPPQRHVQRHERAPERLLRADDDFRRQRGLRRPAEERIAHPVEHVRHRRKINRHFVGEPVGTAARKAPRVVRAAALRIAQHLEGARHLEKRRHAVVARDIRVVPARQLPVRALDFVSARARRNAEDVVVVSHPSQSRGFAPRTPLHARSLRSFAFSRQLNREPFPDPRPAEMVPMATIGGARREVKTGSRAA